MTESQLIVPSFTFKEVALPPEVEKAKAELLLKAGDIEEIQTGDDKTRDLATEVSADIATHLKTFEKGRETAKAPFWRICQDIDATSKKHKKELDDERTRLDQLVGSYEDARRAALAAQQAMIAKQQREADAEAERLAKASEEAATPSLALDAENAADEAAAKQRAIEDQRIAAAEIARKAAPSGGRNRVQVEVEITDIEALRVAFPDCVKLIADFAMIRHYDSLGKTLPGVTIKKTPIYSSLAKK